jgi:hypothetical protein
MMGLSLFMKDNGHMATNLTGIQFSTLYVLDKKYDNSEVKYRATKNKFRK